MDLIDKVVVITGGARGLGKMASDTFSNMGAKVCVFDIEPIGDSEKVDFIQCDLTQPDEVESAVDSVIKKYDVIDVLINNAGFVHSEPLISFSIEGIKIHSYDTWHKTINTNLDGLFYVSVNVIKEMVMKRTRGLIINICSISSEGNAGQSAYSATKSAVKSLTVVWAKELAPFNIRVAGISPGFVSTETTLRVMGDERIKDLKKKIPLRRLAEVYEVVDAILFIIKNDYFHGRVLEIDGGLRI